jgi:hypothetical protein
VTTAARATALPYALDGDRLDGIHVPATLGERVKESGTPGKAQNMSEERKQHGDELSQEELDSLLGEELPQREAMSVLRVPFLSGAPVEAEDAELPDE